MESSNNNTENHHKTTHRIIKCCSLCVLCCSMMILIMCKFIMIHYCLSMFCVLSLGGSIWFCITSWWLSVHGESSNNNTVPIKTQISCYTDIYNKTRTTQIIIKSNYCTDNHHEVMQNHIEPPRDNTQNMLKQ
jgi:hypothetical protein